MKPRFQADASLRAAIVDGVRRREPAIDFRAAQGVLPDGMSDPDVLAFASAEGRILVSHDVHTMPVHFAASAEPSATLFLIPQKIPVTEAIEAILLIWIASEAEEWSGQLIWLPL